MKSNSEYIALLVSKVTNKSDYFTILPPDSHTDSKTDEGQLWYWGNLQSFYTDR